MQHALGNLSQTNKNPTQQQNNTNTQQNNQTNNTYIVRANEQNKSKQDEVRTAGWLYAETLEAVRAKV